MADVEALPDVVEVWVSGGMWAVAAVPEPELVAVVLGGEEAGSACSRGRATCRRVSGRCL